MLETAQHTAITLSQLQAVARRGEKFSCLTAYDASFARLLDNAGIDVVLVGDSLGMVIQGHKTTIPVQVEDIIYHCKAVSRGLKRALLMADMPFMSYANSAAAQHNAARIMQQGGAQMVKLEGGQEQLEIVRKLNEVGVPVCAHLGLRPQFVNRLGGYRVQGRTPQAAATMQREAALLAESGAAMLLLECVPASLAAAITAAVDVPVIGIGAGAHCDGQILVLYDLLGLRSAYMPRFVRDFLAEKGTLEGAIKHYIASVKSGEFPAPEHSFS